MIITLWILAFALVLLSFYFHSKFLNVLKDDHPDLFKELGEPTVFTKYSVSTAVIVKDLSPNNSVTKYTDFMGSKKWVTLGDKNLTMYANRKKIAQYVFGVVFICLLVGGSS